MGRKRLWRWILLLAAAIFAVLAGGNLVYYSHRFPENPMVYLGMSLQNSLLTLLGGPVLTFDQVVTDFGREVFSLPEQWLLAGSFLVSILIFTLHVLILIQIADAFLHFKGWGHKKHRVLVIGSSAHCMHLLEKIPSDMQAYFWSQELLDDEQRRNFLKKQVIAEYRPYPSEDRGKLPDVQSLPGRLMLWLERKNNGKYSPVTWLTDYWKASADRPSRAEKQAFHFLKREKITHIVLADTSDAENIQMYMTLSNCACAVKRTIRFHVHCSNPENRDLLERYFDRQVKRREKIFGKSGSDYHLDLRIFSYPQIYAVGMFARQGLHSFARQRDSAVHLLIIGGGAVGRAVALQAMNQAVITSGNPVVIDIADKDPETVKNELQKFFSSDYVERTAEGFRLEGSKADGSLTIRVNAYQVYEPEFFQWIGNIQESNDAFTYIAVCLPDPDDSLHCIHNFAKVLHGPSLPVSLRMPYSRELKAYLQQQSWCAGADFLGSRDEYIGLGQVVNIREEKSIRRYNAVYEAASGIMDGGSREKPEILWNKLNYFRRETNRALYQHQSVKEYLRKMAPPDRQIQQRAQWNDFMQWIQLRREEQKSLGARELSCELISCWENSEKQTVLQYPDLVEAAKTEHRRFCYNLAARGWCSGPEKIVEERIHDCLVDWDQLRDEVLIYDLISAPPMMELGRKKKWR